MNIINLLLQYSIEAIKKLYDIDIDKKHILIEKSNKIIEGDYSITLFKVKQICKFKNFDFIDFIGSYIKQKYDIIDKFYSIKGFLNIHLKNTFLKKYFLLSLYNDKYGYKNKKEGTIMIEYLSPNTNKPLHLGHLRNAFIGDAMANIISANGYKVLKVNLINDRGIHICKSMLAWIKFGNKLTPKDVNMKEDHFVGKYYVLYEENYKKQLNSAIDKNSISIENELKEMLIKWEKKDKYVHYVWNLMNSWVYKGFKETYSKIGINFDIEYFESKLYEQGKDIILNALEKKIVFSKNDQSIWIDLTKYHLNEKLLLRSDGTSLYITQDIGLAYIKSKYNLLNSIYVVGNEQDHYFKILKNILKEFKIKNNIYHLSYGMVYLPDGKMKSREGNVIDADYIIDLIIKKVHEYVFINKKSDINDDTCFKIGIGSIKYYLLHIDPKKNIIFKINSSIDLYGNTSVFIQYTYARIMSILSNVSKLGFSAYNINSFNLNQISINSIEKNIIIQILEFQFIIEQSFTKYSPAILCNYLCDISRKYNHFYSMYTILDTKNKNISNFRISLSFAVSKNILNGMSILGIEMPNKM